MTTAQLDHLRAIDAHLKHLLEDIAAKRTPGEWGSSEGQYVCADDHGVAECYHRDSDENDHNAAFIASCAGSAEAGWKAARAVIKSYYDSGICREWQGYMQSAIEPILAAFPLESLKA